MDFSPKYNIPWELISASLTDSLSVEEEFQLQQWFASNPDHREKYIQIQELWKNGMEDYAFYKNANENEAWKALHIKLGKVDSRQLDTKVIQRKFTHRPKLLINVLAVAAVFVGLVGIGLWLFLNKNNSEIYETAANVQKKVTLTDGSTILLKPLTRIELSPDYNKKTRTIIMASGEASFDVGHQSNKTFIVELGSTQIKDVGTSFTILKREKMIDITVSSGKVIFMKLSTRETRELPAGTGITFDIQNESFGEIEPAHSYRTNSQMLNFENTPLLDAIAAIEKAYRKKIVISDTTIGYKKITAQLYGMSYPTVMEVICKSLRLEYTIKDSTYILKERK